MQTLDVARRRFLFAVFVVSGFTGLIYESIWSHYLKLFLGHAAYAQSLVLAIFMGGMALGSWVIARYSCRIRRLLLAYVLVEGVIGVLGLLFHPTFRAAYDFSFATAIPALPSALWIHAYKWSLGSLLILPQSVLLGMTFPLISGGLIRRWPDRPGETLATLYFTNSLGAAVGVLVSGFVLIGAVGLPGTIRIAGLLNIALALAIWAAVRGQRGAGARPSPADRRPKPPAGAGPLEPLARSIGRVPHRHRFVHVRARLDPDAEPGARQLDPFIRVDAERVHLRSGLRRAVREPPHRAARRIRWPTSPVSWSPWALWPRSRCRPTT